MLLWAFSLNHLIPDSDSQSWEVRTDPSYKTWTIKAKDSGVTSGIQLTLLVPQLSPTAPSPSSHQWIWHSSLPSSPLPLSKRSCNTLGLSEAPLTAAEMLWEAPAFWAAADPKGVGYDGATIPMPIPIITHSSIWKDVFVVLGNVCNYDTRKGRVNAW